MFQFRVQPLVDAYSGCLTGAVICRSSCSHVSSLRGHYQEVAMIMRRKGRKEGFGCPKKPERVDTEGSVAQSASNPCTLGLTYTWISFCSAFKMGFPRQIPALATIIVGSPTSLCPLCQMLLHTSQFCSLLLTHLRILAATPWSCS